MKVLPRRPVTFGVLAGGALFAFYVTLVSLGQGVDRALAQLRDDAPLLLPIFPFFGAQVGLLVHLRDRATHGVKALSAATGTSGGVSGTAVVACCAHLVPTFLPVVGTSAFAAAFAALRTPLLVGAVVVNATALAVMARALVRASAMASTGPAPSSPASPSRDSAPPSLIRKPET